MKENPVSSLPGIPFLLAVLATAAVSVWLVATGIGPDPDNLGVASGTRIVGGLLLGALAFFSLIGLYKVEPNQAAVLSLFGRYVGTVKTDGLRWNNPFFSKKKISLRVRNFESGKLKVNELDGSPIEIAAVIVWQVQDSAEAVYNVDDYESFVHIQSESALRAMATSYRTRIVAGAVGMVEMALAELQKNGVVQLDEERKAAMVSNLLVVLCGERSTQPIVNAGTLY